MYMSRIELDLAKRNTMLALTSPNKMHGAVEACFPGERKRRLWRIDSLHGKMFLLIVSEDMPQTSEEISHFSVDGVRFESKKYDSFLESIQANSIWHFRLAANPTFSRANGKERGKVSAHVTAEQQKQWLIAKGEKHGFCVDLSGFDILERKTIRFLKGADRQQITLGVCVFDGVLSVTDPGVFRIALTEGIGRGKAYGYGMITVVKAS